MATNKNQHFVPRCYLRPFANFDGAAINVFNIDRLAFIESAPLKGQCAKPYFYGKDLVLETALQGDEAQYASVLRDILSGDYALSEEQRQTLRRFWLLQHLRTEAASRRAVEMLQVTGTVAGADPSQFELEIKDAVQTAMGIFVSEMRVVDDLKVCLLRNRSSVPFITSDDPAVLTNRWYAEDLRTRVFGGFGLGSAGALALLPLTPSVLCLAYDGDVYSVPNENGWVEVRERRDIEALNAHQFLNARANIYTHDSLHAAFVRESFEAVKRLRPVARHGARYAVRDGGEDGVSERFRVVDRAEAEEHTQAIVHTYTIHAWPDVWPRVLRWRLRGLGFTDGSGVGYVRRANAEVLRRRSDFRKQRTRR